MSGGVDSAVAALLERERGAEVLGVTLKLWADPETDGAKACCSPEAVLGARRCRPLARRPASDPRPRGGVPAPRRRRIRLRATRPGATPNPCIVCNGEVRIAAMIDLAERIGATHLVTGHYARIVDDGDGPLLAAAADEAKDQSYMLAALPPELLDRLRFPLTELTKPEVREIAARHGLAVARKPESQDLCFLAGQGKAASCAATAACTTARAPCWIAPRPADRPPPRPSQLHRRPAAGDRGLRRGAALRPCHRRRGQHGHGWPPRRPGGEAVESATRSCTVTAPASTRSGCATARGRSRPRSQPTGPGAMPSSMSSWGRRSPPPLQGRRRCCWPEGRSSATARSPLDG